MATRFQDGPGAFGVPEMLPEVLNAPPGWTLVKLRFRPDEHVTGYFRKDGAFAKWFMTWADAKHLYLEPLYQVAVNLRPATKKTS